MSQLVSIIIPAYNAAPFLPRSVASALAQTYTNIEVVIVDDGSTDETGAVADQLSQQDNRLRVVHQENLGPAEARHNGFKAATGDFIAYLDADDELLPDAITFLYDKCETNQLDLAYGSFVKVREEESYEVPHPFEGVLTGDEYLHFLFDRLCMCASWGNLGRREMYREEVFPPKDQVFPNEDVYMNICMSAYVNRVGIYNKPVVKYYYVPTSLTVTSRHLTSQTNWERFFTLVENNLQSRGKLDALEQELLCMKLDRLAFYVYPLDTSHRWVNKTINDRRYKLPRRAAVLQLLLHYPRLCHWCVVNNRRLKKLFK